MSSFVKASYSTGVLDLHQTFLCPKMSALNRLAVKQVARSLPSWHTWRDPSLKKQRSGEAKNIFRNRRTSSVIRIREIEQEWLKHRFLLYMILCTRDGNDAVFCHSIGMGDPYSAFLLFRACSHLENCWFPFSHLWRVPWISNFRSGEGGGVSTFRAYEKNWVLKTRERHCLLIYPVASRRARRKLVCFFIRHFLDQWKSADKFLLVL